MTRLLALDYGRARVGVAVSAGTLAEPLEVIAPGPNLIPRLRALCAAHDIGTLVVGVSEQGMAEESRLFGENVSKELELPVVYADETLTSVEVQQRLRQRAAGKKSYTGPIDHFAAAVILERYLDDHEGEIL